MNSKNISTAKVLCLTGPTASGKTELAIDLADQFGFELFSADSMQVYQGMDIGTAKPDLNVRSRFHMLDCAEPGSRWSSADYCAAVRKAVKQNQKKPLLFAGGTGLYFEALFTGLADIPAIPLAISKEVASLALKGSAPLARTLQAEDPRSAAEIDLKNPRRVIRALEVFRATGLPLREWHTKTTPSLLPEAIEWLLLDPGKEKLQKKISTRCSQMFERGWALESARLCKKYGETAVLNTGAIGYRQALALSRGDLSLEQALEAVEIQTRQYARRQRSWFKNRTPAKSISTPAEAFKITQRFLFPV